MAADSSPKNKQSLTSFIGTAKGSFATPKEADNFISNERHTWSSENYDNFVSNPKSRLLFGVRSVRR